MELSRLRVSRGRRLVLGMLCETKLSSDGKDEIWWNE